MGDVVVPLEVVVGLVVLFVALVGGFLVRRYLLARNAATFDCLMRRGKALAQSAGRRDPGGWILGIARYGEDSLEWFRIFTINPRPARVLRRAQLDLLEWRQPSDDDMDSVLPESVIVRCSYEADEVVEMAMTRQDYTGFATWLESAPPGVAPAN